MRLDRHREAEAADARDEFSIGKLQDTSDGLRQELMFADDKVVELEKREQELREKAEEAKTAADSAKVAADADPTNDNLILDAKEKVVLSILAEVRLQRAQLDAGDARKAVAQLGNRIEGVEFTIDRLHHLIDKCRLEAEERKAERTAARREARSDGWEAARDRVKTS